MASPAPSLSSSDSSENFTYPSEDQGHVRQLSLGFSDDHGEEEEDTHQGDYSTRMEELFDDGDDDEVADEDEEDEGGFVYTGQDADESPGDYRSQLRDVLGPDAEDEDEEAEELEVENSLLYEQDAHEKLNFGSQHSEILSEGSPSTSSNNMLPSFLLTPDRMPSTMGMTAKLSKPFLNPTISRLRSYTPQMSVASSSNSQSQLFDGASPSPSHFSDISRSVSPLGSGVTSHGRHSNGYSQPDRDVFRWTQLRNIGHHIYAKASFKASAVLGSLALGSPMVMAGNGLICVGTDSGRVFVFDFKQNLKCICGSESSAKTVGAVTAVALSHDHTFVASGHATGHIQLFDLNVPHTPARLVVPTHVAAVTSGRQEGHLIGSRIVSISFVAGRHTAVVSADEKGLAFYHSLGKILFVEAPDTLRILGKYAEDDILDPLRPYNGLSSLQPPSFRRRRKTRNTILAMAPLPLGTSPHPTDSYNIVALLTPAKLVVVGLKPSARTWLRRARDDGDGESPKSKSRLKGTLSWWPSVIPGTANPGSDTEKMKGAANGHDASPSTPILVYSWDNTLYLLRVSEAKVKQTVRKARTGKSDEVEVGTIVFEDAGHWSTGNTVLSVQWLNVNQVIVLTPFTLEVYDVRTPKLVERVQFNAASLISPSLGYTSNGAIPYSESIGDVAHSVRVYKGKIFLLGRDEIQVGTLLTWADRILSHVQDGDFLSAIELARSYYVGEAPGNRNGLPDDPQQRKDVIGEKIYDLMIASVRYTFSEDRMTDGTHVTPDGRGVDRTSLFEGLVVTCARASVALDNFEFLFEDLFQEYEDAGISRIFLEQLESFVLDSNIRSVPPRITQRLVALHEEHGRPDLAERVIWHIDPSCLDINQAILLCQTHYLYDALIYVYTRAMRDYVSPVVQLLGLIRKVQQYRKSRLEPNDNIDIMDESALEPVIMNAYKIYPYLADVLAGLTYPSEEPLDEDEAFHAKKDVYTFLFFGHSSVWPVGEDGRLVLTSDEEGGVEPTYPYARLLLCFDAESFLHSLDIAFEDAYFIDSSQGVSRLVIVKILLDILSSGSLSPSDVTFVNIFIARNVPKYPQFFREISPSALQGILVGLADSHDPSTREDRQLAAEYLLSAYTPHDSDHILHLFQTAGFYRILRSWHRQEQQWAPLISAYLQDSDLHSTEKFASVDDILQTSYRTNKGSLPVDVLNLISDSLPQLLEASVISTAVLLDKHTPEFHQQALDALGQDANHEKFIYLQQLLGPPHPEDDEYVTASPATNSSVNVTQAQRHLYVSLQCQYHPSDVIEVLKHIPQDLLDWRKVMQILEEKLVYGAVIWSTNWKGHPREALSKAGIFEQRLTCAVIQSLSGNENVPEEIADAVDKDIAALEEIGRMGISVCLEHSRSPSHIEVPLEDIWFQLLSSQIHCVQSISGICSEDVSDCAPESELAHLQQHTLSALRSLVQETFGALVSITSTRAVSFPNLFKRLVDTATHAQAIMGTPYTEFRVILSGMLESYRSDGDMLFITKHMVDRDLFETVEEFAQERGRGWTPSASGTCSYCRQPLLDTQKSEQSDAADSSDSLKVIVSRTGAIYHHRCLPS